jgi:hypothetical protein
LSWTVKEEPTPPVPAPDWDAAGLVWPGAEGLPPDAALAEAEKLPAAVVELLDDDELVRTTPTTPIKIARQRHPRKM